MVTNMFSNAGSILLIKLVFMINQKNIRLRFFHINVKNTDIILKNSIDAIYSLHLKTPFRAISVFNLSNWLFRMFDLAYTLDHNLKAFIKES